MTLNTKLSLMVIAMLLPVISFGQGAKAVKEYLNIPGPIVLAKESFSLAWSSHPSTNYYKQEYIGAKDKIEKFKKMVMVEVLVGDSKAEDLAKAKEEELRQLKLSNPMVNYEMFQKNGEILLDFLLSENSADGKKVNIIERNVYRYKTLVDKNGKRGVMLFAVSERSYGNDVDAFLSSLKKSKPTLLNAVAAFVIPEITLKQ